MPGLESVQGLRVLERRVCAGTRSTRPSGSSSGRRSANGECHSAIRIEFGDAETPAAIASACRDTGVSCLRELVALSLEPVVVRGRKTGAGLIVRKIGLDVVRRKLGACPPAHRDRVWERVRAVAESVHVAEAVQRYVYRSGDTTVVRVGRAMARPGWVALASSVCCWRPTCPSGCCAAGAGPGSSRSPCSAAGAWAGPTGPPALRRPRASRERRRRAPAATVRRPRFTATRPALGASASAEPQRPWPRPAPPAVRQGARCAR